jgi:hypothetical protein
VQESIEATGVSNVVDPTTNRRRLARRILVAIAVVGAVSAVGAFSADAKVAIQSFEAFPSTTQAGGHPDVTIRFKVDNRAEPQLGENCQCNTTKDADVELPTGLIADPHKTPQCLAADFAREACPADSQIGVAEPTVLIGAKTVLGPFLIPIYNVVPKPTQAALVAWSFNLLNIQIYTVFSARTGSDYGLNAFTDGLGQAAPIVEYATRFWGVPADSSHDGERNLPGPSNSPRAPFLQNPVRCGVALSSEFTVVGYDESVSHASAPWPQMTGCDQLAFNPSLSAQPTTTDADSPSGLEVDLKVPQQMSADSPSPSEIRATTVTLPVGFSLNPNAADGKLSCSDDEARFGTELEAQCPEYSKIGAVTIDSSALPEPISGYAYLGDPRPDDRYRVFLTVDGFATHIKLAGHVIVDKDTGQLVIAFDDLPQSPLTEFNLHVFGSERGVLATPTHCGTYAVHSTFTPWDEALAKQSATQFFVVDSGPGGSPCPGQARAFGPSFVASSVGNIAGAHSPFSIHLTRKDGDQNLGAVTVTPPPGLLATLAGIPYCPESALAEAAKPAYAGLSQIASPSCPAASQIGISDAGVGAGTHQAYLPGRVYLAGPYKGAPLSTAVITPVVSGPYDLGNVVVRAAIRVDPETARITFVSDPLPQIFEGIPLRLRSILVSVNRDRFMLNPTNCDPFTVDGEFLGDQGAVAGLGSPFQVANCANLSFSPKLGLRLSGGVRRRGHPAIHAVLASRPGEANLRRLSVTVPNGELLDNSHIGTVCTRPLFASDSCPAGSKLGQVVVNTPLLDRPLTGSAYLRSSAHDLPDLALDLKGQVDFVAVARVDSVDGRLRATFAALPDVPISSVALDLAGGVKGLLQNSKTLCGSHKKASIRMTGQNGANLNVKTALQVSCGPKARHKRRLEHPRRADQR